MDAGTADAVALDFNAFCAARPMLCGALLLVVSALGASERARRHSRLAMGSTVPAGSQPTA